MAQPITPAQLDDLFNGSAPFALVDVREAGEYNASHIPGSSLMPRRMLEFDLPVAIPHTDSLAVLCDDDGQRVAKAVATVEAMGYSNVAWLDGGVNRWMSLDYPTEWGVNVPSKDFGEKVEVVHHVPEIDAIELRSRMDRGEKMVILDTRTPEEYRRFCIPGGQSLPGGELALRITDVTADLGPDTTVVINCAGRTRSIIGTRILQRMGLDRDIVGLKNGTSGWVLAGYELESGADRDELPPVSSEGRAAAEAYADRCAAEDGVDFLDIAGLETAGRTQPQRDRLLHRRAHRRGIRCRTHCGLSVVSRRSMRAAERRRGRGEKRSHRVLLRRTGAGGADRIVVPAAGPRRGLCVERGY